MSVYEVMPGVKLLQDSEGSILFGCPPEVIKRLIGNESGFPDCIVLPDTLYRGGVLQNCTEFPLYYYIFVLGNIAKGKRLCVVGEAEAIEANRELLRLTLLGPTQEEYGAFSPSSHFATLYAESRYLAVKNKEGGEIPIDGFVDFRPFVRGEAEIHGQILRHLGTDAYQLGQEGIELSKVGDQEPVYDLKVDYAPKNPYKFGVDILGGGSGFTPGKPSSAVMLNYNAEYMLIDCPPYLDQHLRARGVAREQLRSIFLTHIHDDHCNIFPLVEFGSKVKFLGTREIYWMALKKLSLQTALPFESFASFFDFVELEPYAETDFYGVKIRPHYTVHSIPTIGASFSMKEGGRLLSIGFGGDNKALPHIRQMVEAGITPRSKLEYLEGLYRQRFDLLMIDGGMGLLHGDPEDAMASESERVVFMHLEKLPEKFDATFSMALPGKRYAIANGKNDACLIKAMEILNRNYPGLSPEWANAIMSNLSIEYLNSGDIVMKQGEARKGSIYIILSGSCAVMYHDGQRLAEIAQKTAGELIGDMAIVRRDSGRSASVVAKTPVILGAIDEDVYYSFVSSENRLDGLAKLWEKRKALEGFAPFSGFDDIVNERLAKVARLSDFGLGQDPFKNGDGLPGFALLLDGSLEKAGRAKPGDVLKPGSLFSAVEELPNLQDMAGLSGLGAGRLMVVSAEDFCDILSRTPILLFTLRSMRA